MIASLTPRGLERLQISPSDIRLRIPKHDHIPALPLWIRILMLLQATLSLIILALTAAVLDHTPYSPSTPSFSLSVCIAALLIFLYRVSSVLWFPVLYHRVVVLGAECLLVVGWLSAFVALASYTSRYAWLDRPVCTIDPTGDRYCIFRPRGPFNARKERDLLAASASLGALQFILSVIILVVYSIHFHRMRFTGAPYTHNGRWTPPLEPSITPTGLTMADAIAHPIMTPVEPARQPPVIETIRTSSPGAGFVEQRTFAAAVGQGGDGGEGGRKPGDVQITHSGSFFIDDGIVSPTDSMGRSGAQAEPRA